MARKNEFVRMSWWEAAPYLTMPDVSALQSELKRLYPTLVMFPRSYHFHELGEEPRRPEFVNDMVEHFKPTLNVNGKYAHNYALALRVPWPEDIATGNPQRLIGRPHRRPYQDSKEAFRRFGRTVYFQTSIYESGMMLAGITIEPPPAAVAAALDMPVEAVPSFRILASLGGFRVELPYDTEDPEVTAFAKTVSSILSKQAVRTSCTYDGLTREPVFVYSHMPISKRYLQRCAVEPDLHVHLGGVYQGRLLFRGPTPVQRWKWRREAGLPPEPKPAPLRVPKFLPHESLKWSRENSRRIPVDLHLEMNKMANRAMYDYVAAQTPGFVPSPDIPMPTILPETDIWSRSPRQHKDDTGET
ncbi:MAG: hypothetical protein HYU58_16710 [Proteobacteria bacterium]|nr:hypothetical protein [Pseudomonadota bacterium]